MGAAHPRLYRAERVFDGAAAEGHVVWVATQTAIHPVDQIFPLAAGNPTLVAGTAISLERASLASVDPESPDRDAAFLGRVAVCQVLARRADIDIPFGVVDEVRLDIYALCRIARGRRSRHGRGDARLMASQDLGAAEIALVGDVMSVVPTKGDLGRDGHRAELLAVEALIGDLMRENEMSLGIHSTLYIVADQPAVPRAGRHRAGVGVRQENWPSGASVIALSISLSRAISCRMRP